MIDNITRWLTAVPAGMMRDGLRSILAPIGDRYSTQNLTSAGLVIKAGSSALVKGGSAFYSLVQGVLVTKAANTDMAALAGTVANAAFNIYCFFIDKGGTLTTVMGVPGATLALVKFPPFPVGKALVGFVIINPTGTGDFVGGTTALDDGTVTPGALYVNAIGPMDPTVKL